MADHNKIVDDVIEEVRRAVRSAKRDLEREWEWAKEDLSKNRDRAQKKDPTSASFEFSGSDFATKLRDMPDQIADWTSGGGFIMRYFFAFGFRTLAALMALGSIIAISVGVANGFDSEPITVGLAVLTFSQLVWWSGTRIKRSADRKRYARDQNRLLRLAWKKGGNLTVLEAASSLRLTVEQTEEMLRELSARGHAEVRVSESGLIVYHFLEIERESEKFGARPVDEL